MPDALSDPAFAELAGRCLNGTASAAEHEALGQALLQDAERAREYAALARFESLLRQTCRRNARAFLEYAALEAASEPGEDAVAVQETTPRAAPVRWRSGFTPWLRVAAAFIALAGIASFWITQQHAPAPQAAHLPPPPVRLLPSVPHKMVLLAPRVHELSPAHPASGPSTSIQEAPPVLTLAARLDDFYLPAVSLRQVRAQDAADWLTAQLREHNYARRPDLNQLTLQMPHSVAGRFVTLESGPISFKRALEIIATLAGGEASVSESSIQIVDHETPAADPQPTWQSSPWGKEGTQQHAAALGIALDDTALKVESSGAVSLRLPEPQQRALGMLAGAQHQLASLAPLSFVPLLVPAGAAGPERVLTAASVDVIRQQLDAAAAGTLPVVSLSFSDSTQGFSLLNSSGMPAVTLKVTPVGEMNQVTIEPATTTVVTPGNLLADNTSHTAPPPTAVDALVTGSQGVVISLGDGSTTLYTAEGIPIPPGYEYLYGLSAAPDESAGTTLVLVPYP